jgi:hypothetical protein
MCDSHTHDPKLLPRNRDLGVLSLQLWNIHQLESCVFCMCVDFMRMWRYMVLVLCEHDDFDFLFRDCLGNLRYMWGLSTLGGLTVINLELVELDVSVMKPLYEVKKGLHPNHKAAE